MEVQHQKSALVMLMSYRKPLKCESHVMRDKEKGRNVAQTEHKTQSSEWLARSVLYEELPRSTTVTHTHNREQKKKAQVVLTSSSLDFLSTALASVIRLLCFFPSTKLKGNLVDAHDSCLFSSGSWHPTLFTVRLYVSAPTSTACIQIVDAVDSFFTKVDFLAHWRSSGPNLFSVSNKRPCYKSQSSYQPVSSPPSIHHD